MEKCICGSLQFKYSGDCLSCGLTKKEMRMYVSIISEVQAYIKKRRPNMGKVA